MAPRVEARNGRPEPRVVALQSLTGLGFTPVPDVLFLAAFEPELAPLRAAVANGTGAGLGARSAGIGQPVGVGLVLAAVGAARALAEGPAQAVVLLGTCGAYKSAGWGPGTVVVARRVHLVDPSALSRAAEFPPPMPTSLDADPRLVEALADAGARPADIATTLAITVDDRAAAFVAQATATHVEHLEAFAVAAACAASNVRFAAVLGVANRVGASARAEWRANHVHASEQAAGVVLRWLRKGAAGLVD